MIVPPPNVHVWLACGHTDLRRGFDGLASLAQNHLGKDPFSGQLLVFRGRRGDLIKVLWWDGQGLCLFAKRLEKGRFVWPQAKDGAVFLTPAQLSMLLEGIDWRMPTRTWRPDHPRNPAITARNIATGVSRRIRTLPPDGRTTSIAAAP